MSDPITNGKFTHVEKNPGDLIRSADWNAATKEVTRLETAKVNRLGTDNIQGPLTIEEALTINSPVGIGKPASDVQLEVAGKGGTNVDLVVNGRLRSNNDNGGLWVASDRFVGGHDTNKIGFWNNGKWRLSVEPDGQIGIGITNPSATLQVAATSQDANGKLLVLGENSGSNLRLGYHDNYSWIQSHGGKPLAINPIGNNVGIGTDSPDAKLSVVGTVSISNGNHGAVKSNRMASGSLTIGSTDVNYGGGSNWNSSTAGLLLETKDNTEIAVHDAGKRLTSLMYYEGDTVNRLTIGRDMGWGSLSMLSIDAKVGIHTDNPVASLDIAAATRTNAANHPSSANGIYVTGNFRPGSNGVEFRHTNGTQGIGFGYNTIYATGSNTEQDLNISARGTGKIGLSGEVVVNNDIVKQGDWGATLGGSKTDHRVRIGELWSSSGIYGLDGLKLGSSKGCVQIDQDLYIDKGNGLRFRDNDTSRYWTIYPQWGDAGDPDLMFDYSKKTRETGWVRGWLEPEGGWKAPSDGRLKQDILSLTNVLDRVMQLRPKSYRWLESDQNSRRFVGFIAQDVEQVFPDFVSQKSDIKGLNYSNFAVLAIAAIQEQQQQIEALRVKVRQLQESSS